MRNLERFYANRRIDFVLNRLSFYSAVYSVGLTLFLTGCTTKKSADLKARESFLAGQQQAMAQWQQQAAGNSIQVTGEVRNGAVEWRDGLTLSQAIVEAEYDSPRDPREILVIRFGQVITVKPRDLLSGRDVVLQPGDRIEIRR